MTMTRDSLLRKSTNYILSFLAVAALTVVISLLKLEKNPANLPMLFLLVVILSALMAGRSAAVFASVCSFLAINWFFVTPRYTFTVRDPSEWIALCVFLFTAIVTGQLMALLKARALEAHQHQRETEALAEASWAVASRLDSRSALAEVARQVSRVVELEWVGIWVLEKTESEKNGGKPRLLAAYPQNMEPDLAALESGLGCRAENSSSSQSGEILKLPIEMNGQELGTVNIKLRMSKTISGKQKHIIDSLVNHSAVILQREGLMKTEAKAVALADADRLKTALLSMVSHDFRSPLTTIKASVSTLQSEGQPIDSESQRSLYQAIELEADRLNRMVGNILDLSRLQADAWKPKLESCSVSELIGMVLSSFDQSSNERILVVLDPKLGEILLDCVQIAQVLKNLIENALKYSPADANVTVETHLANDEAIIEVLDRGQGISAEEMKNIFEPFYRARHLQESSLPGIGIGLAVSKGLVEAHSGRLLAENRQDGGAVFRVILPLQQNSATKKEKAIDLPQSLSGQG